MSATQELAKDLSDAKEAYRLEASLADGSLQAEEYIAKFLTARGWVKDSPDYLIQALEQAATDLEFLDLCGQTIFPVYSVSGAISGDLVMYLVHEPTSRALPILVPHQAGNQRCAEAISIFIVTEAVARFQELAHPVNFDDGSDLGINGLDLRQAIRDKFSD